MTTIIAFKENNRWHLAADSRVSMGNLYDDNFNKLCRSGPAWYAICGDARQYIRMARQAPPESITELLDQFKSKSSEAMLLATDNTGKNLWLLDSAGYLQEIRGKKFYAIGSGAAHASGALAMGASPEKAIAVAKQFDSATGGPVRTTRKWK